MNVTFVFRHLSEPSGRVALEERLVELASALERYFVELRSVHWTVSEDAGSLEVTCQLAARSGTYQASGTHADAFAAANLAFEKLVKQRRRVKKQRLGGRRGALARSQSSEAPAPSELEVGDDGEVQ